MSRDLRLSSNRPTKVSGKKVGDSLTPRSDYFHLTSLDGAPFPSDQNTPTPTHEPSRVAQPEDRSSSLIKTGDVVGSEETVFRSPTSGRAPREEEDGGCVGAQWRFPPLPKLQPSLRHLPLPKPLDFSTCVPVVYSLDLLVLTWGSVSYFLKTVTQKRTENESDQKSRYFLLQGLEPIRSLPSPIIESSSDTWKGVSTSRPRERSQSRRDIERETERHNLFS